MRGVDAGKYTPGDGSDNFGPPQSSDDSSSAAITGAGAETATNNDDHSWPPSF